MDSTPVPASRAQVFALLSTGALAVALLARLSTPLPGSPVPQSLQTLAVVVVGGLFGARRAAAALLLYLAFGALGLPVFADGAAGVGRLWGPTAGYLSGFVVGAGFTGWWVAREGARFHHGLVAVLWSALGMAIAHALILGAGWGRLALLVGPGDALAQGVLPFAWGGVVKSLVGATLVVAGIRMRERAGKDEVHAGQARPEPPAG